MDNTTYITPPDTKLSDTELEELQHLALSEGCDDPKEAMGSRTAKVVLARVSDLMFHPTNGEGFSPMIASIYDKFLSKTPITREEHTMLLSVFQFSTNKQRAVDIVSKLKFAYGRDSKEFLATYIMDHEGGINPMGLIWYIEREISEYKLVLDENEDNVQELGKVAGIGMYYTCEEVGDGAEKGKKLILVTEEGKMVRYEYVFKIIKLLGDGLIFGVTQEKDEYSEDKLIGNILENKGGVLINIYPESGMIGARLEMNGMIITTWKNGEKGLLKEIIPEEENRFVVEGVEEKRKHRKIIELRPMIYDKLYFQGKEGFIFTSLQTHGGPLNQVHIYDSFKDEAGDGSLSFVKTLLHGSKGGDIQLRDHGYFTDTAKGKVNISKYDEEKEEIIEIEGLQGIINDEEEINKLIRGEIAYLQYAGKGGLYTLEHETGKLNTLGTVDNSEKNKFRGLITTGDRISLFYSTENGKKNKQKNFWSHNGELYESPGFANISKWLKYNFPSGNTDHFSFQSMEPYLKKVDGPIYL